MGFPELPLPLGFEERGRTPTSPVQGAGLALTVLGELWHSPGSLIGNAVWLRLPSARTSVSKGTTNTGQKGRALLGRIQGPQEGMGKGQSWYNLFVLQVTSFFSQEESRMFKDCFNSWAVEYQGAPQVPGCRTLCLGGIPAPYQQEAGSGGRRLTLPRGLC